MRVCAKMRCGAEPVAAISLRYQAREVVVSVLASERDPSVLELCREHTAKMTPPVGWVVLDERDALIGASP
jgi:Protein of unknown function (DUF3499)